MFLLETYRGYLSPNFHPGCMANALATGLPGAAPELEAKLSSAVLGFGSSHRVSGVTDEPRSEYNRLGIRGACKWP